MDTQFVGPAGLTYQQRPHRGLADLVHNAAHRHPLGPGGIHNVLLGLFRLSDLEQAQDHMELIHKFMGIGPHSLHHMLHARQIIRHTGQLGAVAEDAHRTGQRSILIQRHPVSQHPNLFQRVHTHVILRLAGAEDAVQRGTGIDLMEGPAYGSLPVNGEHLRRRLVEKNHLLLCIDGQDALLKRVQDILPLVEPAGKGVRLITHQRLLDAAGQAHGQQRTQHCRHHTHRQQAKHRVQTHQSHAAEVDSYNDEADHFPRLVPHRGIGGVVRAHGPGLIGGVGGLTGQRRLLGRPHIGGADQGAVRHIEQFGLGVPHQDQVNIGSTAGGFVQIIGQLLYSTLPLQGLLDHRYLGQNGRGIEQIVVKSRLFTAQGKIEGTAYGKSNGYDDNHQVHPHQSGTDGGSGLCGHRHPPPLLPV